MSDPQKIDDGGPAFPYTGPYDMPDNSEVLVAFPGMSLRDWFAGQAMAALVAAGARPDGQDVLQCRDTSEVAAVAVQYADATIAALKDPSHG